MKAMRILFWVFYLLIASLAVSSCSKDEAKSRLTVYLTDAPAAYDAVNIEVIRLEIKASDDNGDNGWQELPLNAGVYNLLEFTNGLDTMLSTVELPAGKVSQLRMVLGTNNTIVVRGTTMPLPLETPSAQQSGLKFNIHADLAEGVHYRMWIDFDVARSIVETGGGDYKLKPVLRTFTEATSGSIKGNVQPAAAEAVVHAIQGTDSLSALPDPITGSFLIRGVPPGTWKVVGDGNNGYNDNTVDNVIVTLGQVTTIDTIRLTQ